MKRYNRWMRCGIFVVLVFISTANSDNRKTASPVQMAEVDSSVQHKISKRYSPVLYFSEGEDFFPIEVKSYLDHSQLMERIPFFLKDRVVSDSVTPAVLERNSSKDYYLRLRKENCTGIASYYQKIRKTYSRTIYSKLFEVKNSPEISFVLYYWFFFWGSKAGSVNFTWHQCDWEMFMLYLNRDYEPIYIGLSQHYYGSVKNWEDINREECHPVIYVARGSHGLYLSPGKHKAYYDKNKKWRLGSDICEAALHWSPGNYQIVVLNDSLGWLNFKGYWGTLTTTRLPGPKFRHPKDPSLTMWRNPLGWFEKYRVP